MYKRCIKVVHHADGEACLSLRHKTSKMMLVHPCSSRECVRKGMYEIEELLTRLQCGVKRYSRSWS